MNREKHKTKQQNEECYNLKHPPVKSKLKRAAPYQKMSNQKNPSDLYWQSSTDELLETHVALRISIQMTEADEWLPRVMAGGIGYDYPPPPPPQLDHIHNNKRIQLKANWVKLKAPSKFDP